MSRYLVTAALPYANGPIHIGHLAGAYLPADIFVRYLRLKGEDVLFICGSDEHGVPITLRARKEGVTPQQIVDKYHSIIKKSFADFGIAFDIYHRTSDPLHHQTASEFFKTLYDKNVFTEEESEQYFDEEAQMFLADRYITGTCPNCSNPNAYGDQCEKCGKSLSPRDLINPHSQLSGKPPILKKTKHWYLPLDKMQKEWLEKWIYKQASDWKGNVFGQCISWLKQGLQPRAVTRDLDWGVKVPLLGTEGKVLYVWFDAPIGYISATKALFEQRGDKEGWKKYWQNSESKLIHFIGKDNIVFHCIIFPAMLKAHGGYILPDNVPANEFLNLEGEKLSTSRNWAVWLNEYLEEFPDKQDELRYVLCSTFPENKDNDFTWKDFQARVNNELADILGNYIKRVIDLVHKFCDGKVPPYHSNILSEEESAKLIDNRFDDIAYSIENFNFREALSKLINLARKGNQFLQDYEPWKLIKTDKPKVEHILRISIQNCIELAILCIPFLPHTSKKIFKQLNISYNNEIVKWYSFDDKKLSQIIETGHSLNASEILFNKIEDNIIEKQINKLHSSKEAKQSSVPQVPQTPKNEISYDEFSKMDLRIGTILTAERVPKTDKLMKLTIDTGVDKRTVVSGIAHCFEPEKIIGQQVAILVNLQPRKIKGIESHGMILMAEEDGKLKFVMPSEKINAGSKIT